VVGVADVHHPRVSTCRLPPDKFILQHKDLPDILTAPCAEIRN
jgi:hypothetical protein